MALRALLAILAFGLLLTLVNGQHGGGEDNHHEGGGDDNHHDGGDDDDEGNHHGDGGGEDNPHSGGGEENWSWGNGNPPAFPTCTLANLHIFANFINEVATSRIAPGDLILGALYKAVACDAWLGQIPKQFAWFVFLGASSNYVNGPPIVNLPLPNLFGVAPIMGTFNSIGLPTAEGGSGFAVQSIEVQTILLTEGDGVLSFVNKTLVTIDPERAGTTLNNEWQSFITFQVLNQRPWVNVRLYKETINTQAVLAWGGACEYFCVDCPAGSICP